MVSRVNTVVIPAKDSFKFPSDFTMIDKFKVVGTKLLLISLLNFFSNFMKRIIADH